MVWCTCCSLGHRTAGGGGRGTVKVIREENVILWYLLVRRYEVGGSTSLDLCLWGGKLPRLAWFGKGGRVEGRDLTSSTRICLHLKVGDIPEQTLHHINQKRYIELKHDQKCYV